MKSLCLVLADQYTGFFEQDRMEALYTAVYKRLCALLYARSKCCFTLYFTGPQLDWLSRYHPECLELLAEMADRKQIELIGGGYYEPLLPLLLPRDRAGQLELMTQTLRRLIGKRPRGAKLICDVWDPSLISCLQSANIEYILADSSILPPSLPNFRPVIVEALGKSLCIVSEYSEFTPSQSERAAPWLHRIASRLEAEKDAEIAVCRFSSSEARALLDTSWFDELFSLLETGFADFESVLPQKYLRASAHPVSAWVPPSMHEALARYTLAPSGGKGDRPSIHSFLSSYPECRSFYTQMIQTSIEISQYRGDRSRKKAACEELWKAQSGAASLFFGRHGLNAAKQRSDALKSLITAQRFVREAVSSQTTGPICYDMNADGNLEYLFKHEKYTAGVTQLGGSLFLLTVQNAGSCTSLMTRRELTEGIEDDAPRSLFADRLIQRADLPAYIQGKPLQSGNLASTVYHQDSFNVLKKDLRLRAQSSLHEGCAIELRKCYVSHPDGLQVRFILTNISTEMLDMFFLTELTLALPVGREDEVFSEILCEPKTELITLKATVPLPLRHEAISVVRISNEANNLLFIFEPNEPVYYCQFPLRFQREGDCYEGDTPACAQSLVAAFYWPLRLAPSFVMEKTITLSMLPIKTRK